MSDLSIARTTALLTTARLGRSLELKERTESTNDDARRAALAGAPHGHTVVADGQTRGRGSRGRSWSSPSGTDLYLSLVLKLALPPAQLPPLTLAVGLAVAEALDPLLPRRALVKWPNDIWVDGHKLAGILVEGCSLGDQAETLVVGIGVNVNRQLFPPDLATPATSLALQRGGSVPRSELLARLLNRLEPRLELFEAEGPGPIVAALGERLALRGEHARCDDGGERVTGVVEGIASSGALLLRTVAGVRECYAGTLRACDPGDEAPA